VFYLQATAAQGWWRLVWCLWSPALTADTSKTRLQAAVFTDALGCCLGQPRAGKELREAGVGWRDVFVEVPIKIHNSSLAQALIAGGRRRLAVCPGHV
jgi:hypothetical protein